MRNNLSIGSSLLLALLLLTNLSTYGQQLASVRTFPNLPAQDEQLPRTTLKSLLLSLEQQYQVSIIFNSDAIGDQQVPAPTGKGQKLESTLEKILSPLGLQHKKIEAQVYVIQERKRRSENVKRVDTGNLMASSFTAPAPTPNRRIRESLLRSAVEQTVSGTVTDAETGEALPGVNILAKGTSTGTVTDVEGNYRLTVADDITTLVFSSIGYTLQEVPINGRSVINLGLTPDVQSLSEVVVVGYGVQKKVSVTNSVSQIKGEEITRRPVANTQQSLQGFAPGVTVIDQGGRPGNNDINIRIRGITTLGDNNPLIIVDGIEQRMSDINPDDIESISVLKDAASTAIYGSRAANGVVLITTKRAKEGKVNINYHGYYALQNATNRPRHMDLESLFRLENVAHENAGRQAPYSEEYIQEYVNATDRTLYPLPYPWYEKGVLLKTAPQQNHTLSISGGNETAMARMSLRHQNIDGIAPNFSDKVNEFRVNTDIKATDKLKFSADLNYRTSESRQPSVGEWGVFNFMLHGSKFTYPKYPTGEYGLGPRNINPLMAAEQSGIWRSVNDYLIGSIKADYEIAPNLVFSTQYALRYSNTQTKDFARKYTNRDPVNNRFMEVQMNSLTEIRNSLKEYTLNSILTYHKNIGKHGASALLGYSTINNESNNITGFRQDFYNNDIRSLNQGSNDNRNATGFDAGFGLRSYFSRVNYSYDDKYFFEANARYDGSSRFDEKRRFSFFPSFSAGWRISEEAFWSDLEPVINEFKLRASWGQTGNQAVGLYTFFETLSAVNYTFGGLPVQGYTQTDLANQNLTWETTRQTNIGFDMGMFEDRLTITFDVYNKVTDNILLNLPIPGTIGLGAPPQNAGMVENKGYEIAINYRGGKEFKYNVGFNFSDNRNEVLNLVDTGPYISGNSTGPRFVIAEGLPINSHWGYLTDGFFQTQEEVDNYPTLFPNSKPGDVKYLDINDDGIINPDDNAYLGLSFPRFDFGMNANFSYKNFELFMQWQGSAGHKTRLEGVFQQLATFETFTHEIYTDSYWTPERTDARFARPIKGDSRNFQTSDYQMINADYLRLKNIVLSYNIPSILMEKIFLQSARVYVGATNLLTFSQLNEWDLDPETRSGRGNFYPQVSMYTVGLNVNF